MTQSEIFQAFISWNVYDYGLQIMKTHNLVSQKIRILHKINKKRIFKKDMSSFWKVCSFLCTQYLVGAPFAWITASMRRGMIYCINVAWHELLHQCSVAWITASMQRGMIYCINVAWHGGNQPVALLRCNENKGSFDSSLRVICIVGSGVSHLPLDNTP